MKLRKLSSGISVAVFVVASSVTMVPLSRSVIVVLTVFMRFPWIIVVRVTVLAPPWAPGIVICWSITTAAVAMASSATSVATTSQRSRLVSHRRLAQSPFTTEISFRIA